MQPFQLKKPLPRRGSVEALRLQLIEYLVETRPDIGSRFLSDHELTRITSLSRPTVRRVLEELSREGWIERRHGSGTFIGPRMAMPHVGPPAAGSPEGRPVHRQSIRLAVMIYLLGDLVHDWYSRGVLVGLDRAAYEAGVAIELVGDQDGDVKQLSRRLMQTRPDVLALIAPPPRRVPLIGECSRLDIHCVGTGSFLASLGIPAVQEDGAQGAQLAVQRLTELGHRRIGLVMPPYPIPWVFDRRRGYLAGLTAAGIEADERMLLWLGGDDEEKGAAMLSHYLDRVKPTALLFGSAGGTRFLGPLIRSGKLVLPRDLSVVHFDQNPQCEHWLGLKPAVVRLPLEEMGSRLAVLARDLVEGKEAPDQMRIACTLDEGESLASPRQS